MSSQPEKKQWVGSVCFSSLYVCICLCVLRKYGLIGNPGQKIFRDSIFHHILHRIEYTLEPELMNVLSEKVLPSYRRYIGLAAFIWYCSAAVFSKGFHLCYECASLNYLVIRGIPLP